MAQYEVIVYQAVQTGDLVEIRDGDKILMYEDDIIILRPARKR